MLRTKISASLGITAAAMVLGAIVASGPAWAGAGKTRLEAPLTGDTLASGTAKWESRSDRMKLSVEAEDLSGATATASIFCNSTSSPDVAIDAGFFDLNLDTRVGDNVPVCAIGDTVTVTTDGGDTITGTFGPK
jgi:hypothetical protein